MKTFILVGETVVTLFQHADWSLLEKAILEQLKGWNDFIELSEQDLKDIEVNTKIEIEW